MKEYVITAKKKYQYAIHQDIVIIYIILKIVILVQINKYNVALCDDGTLWQLKEKLKLDQYGRVIEN